MNETQRAQFEELQKKQTQQLKDEEAKRQAEISKLEVYYAKSKKKRNETALFFMNLTTLITWVLL